MKIRRSFFIALMLPFFLGGFGDKETGTSDVTSVEKAFKNPDGSARPKVYWCTNLKERGSRELTWAETPLLESGLLGPITLHVVKRKD